MRSTEAEKGMAEGWNMGLGGEGGGISKRGHSLSTFVYSEINRPCHTRYQRKRGRGLSEAGDLYYVLFH